MSDNEVYRLRKEVEYLRDYIEQQRKRHSADIKTLRDDLYEETKYSKKLRAELEKEYKHCEKLRKQLEDKKRAGQDLRDELDDERAYSEKLERKLDKRAKVIKELEADLLDLEDEYAEARRALKRLDQFKCEAKNAEIYRSYCKQRIKQLQDENHSLRTTSRTSSPSDAPAVLHYAPSRGTPQTQVHVISNSPRLRGPSPRPQPQPQPQPQPPTVIRSRLRTPPASTPSLESDYSEYEDEEQDDDARLTEDDDVQEEVAEAEADAAEYSDAEDEFVTPVTNGTPEDADADADTAPGQKLRELATKEGLLADREYERSREAYAHGDHAFAKKLKDAGAQHRNNMRNYNRMAAAEIFNHHNPEYNTNPNARGKIDLHHLHVREAKEFVENHIQLCRRAGLGSTDIISGRGNHSAGGVAKIRPAIMEYLESQQDVAVDPHETNPGRIVVRFLDTGRPKPVVEDEARQRRRVRTAAGPEHSDVDDVFEHGRTRLKAAMRTADEVRQDIDEIEHGMDTLRIKPESRRGLRDISNRN